MEKPFFHSSKYKWTLTVSTGLFLYFFLIFFLPFGVDNYNPDLQYDLTLFTELFAFLFTVSFTTAVLEFGIKHLLQERSGTSFYLFWTLFFLVIQSFIVYLVYNFLGNWHDWSLLSGLSFQLNVSSVLIFPVTGTFFYFRYLGLKSEFQEVRTRTRGLKVPEQMITFEGKGNRDRISITLNAFLYARAQDNYMEIHYRDQESEEHHMQLLRATLSGLEKTIHSEWVRRCHRSYLVNLYQVISAKEGTSGLELFVSGLSVPLPVSKSYRIKVLEALDDIKVIKDSETHHK
ncbi:LytTR family transcriptional regulator DNA-binding domain-containing protein [Balneola sp. MJW-20]|uniref:LytTR family transcriptional regulator DNA-binding domain-containing protein n=1 Tax=Gracilimonas aurantiaca TaxID=3234185 RepID=UPI003464FA97